MALQEGRPEWFLLRTRLWNRQQKVGMALCNNLLVVEQMLDIGVVYFEGQPDGLES